MGLYFFCALNFKQGWEVRGKACPETYPETHTRNIRNRPLMFFFLDLRREARKTARNRPAKHPLRHTSRFGNGILRRIKICLHMIVICIKYVYIYIYLSFSFGIRTVSNRNQENCWMAILRLCASLGLKWVPLILTLGIHCMAEFRYAFA